MSQHTPEPWTNNSYSGFIIKDTQSEIIGSMHGKYGVANSRRIVACVNACAGIPTEKLERSADTMLTLEAARANSHAYSADKADLLAQRDELLAALKAGLSLYESCGLVASITHGLAPGKWANSARAAIEKAEGK